MIVCDEYLALAALTNNLPQEIGQDQIAATPTAYDLLTSEELLGIRVVNVVTSL